MTCQRCDEGKCPIGGCENCVDKRNLSLPISATRRIEVWASPNGSAVYNVPVEDEEELREPSKLARRIEGFYSKCFPNKKIYCIEIYKPTIDVQRTRGEFPIISYQELIYRKTNGQVTCDITQ